MHVRFFSNTYQEILLMHQQTLLELLQDLEQQYRSDVLVIKPGRFAKNYAKEIGWKCRSFQLFLHFLCIAFHFA
jgi:cytoskeletal protein RodZ